MPENVDGWPHGYCHNFKAHPEPHEWESVMPGTDLAMMLWCPGRDTDWG